MITIVVLLSVAAVLSLIIVTYILKAPKLQGSPPTGLVLYDTSGVTLVDKLEQRLVANLWSSIVEAPLCPRGWVWNPADNLAKLSFSFSDGAERRFVLLRTDRIVELGPAPNQACRTLNSQEFMDRLLATSEAP